MVSNRKHIVRKAGGKMVEAARKMAVFVLDLKQNWNGG